MSRAYRRLRTAGQDVPACNRQTMEYLQTGGNLIMWPVPFPESQAAAAWEAHRHHVLEDWRIRDDGALPMCWAQLRFDDAAQIETKGLDPRLRDRITSIG